MKMNFLPSFAGIELRRRAMIASIVASMFTAIARHSVHATEPNPIEFFEKKIRPVLVAECVDCHNAEKQKGGLRLDHREAWKKGSLYFLVGSYG